MTACNLRSLLVAAIFLSNCIAWTSSRHHYAHNVSGHRSRHRRQGTEHFLPASFVIPGGEGEGWGDWGPRSPCSRTCGGGVAHQKRICLTFSANGTQCSGGDTRYFSCETQDCPAGAIDFRAEQCSKFNDIPFKGVNYEWIPVTNTLNPCELNCMPHRGRFFNRHVEKVIDGTRCNADSYDVCVNGQCLSAGCDKMLGSSAREDKCRECRGTGANCHTIKDDFISPNYTAGYNDILLIPKGSTNIIIEEKASSYNYLGLRSMNGSYYLNGNYRIDLPKSVEIAGALWHYQRDQYGLAAPDKLRSLGPTKETLLLSMYLFDTDVGINYEFSVPNNTAPPTDKRYHWMPEEFAPCTLTCGGGYQSRNVTCRSDLGVVNEALCDEALRPVSEQLCNPQPCPARWQPGPWGNCSQKCGKGGVRYRNVTCDSDGKGCGERECLDLAEPKPELSEKCNEDIPCPKWFVGRWNECDLLCGEGMETRQVVCHTKINGRVSILDDDDCDEKKPEDTRPCLKSYCDGVDWVYTEWTKCDSCLTTVSTRQVLCTTNNTESQVVNDTFCAHHKKPPSQQPCTVKPACDTMWYATQWGKCSVECGEGVQERRVFCGSMVNGSVVEVEESECDPELKYNVSKPCSVPLEECPLQWHMGAWSACQCGSRVRRRQVMCFKGVTKSPNCSIKTLVDTAQLCREQPCDTGTTTPKENKDGLPYCDEVGYGEVGLDYGEEELLPFPKTTIVGDLYSGSGELPVKIKPSMNDDDMGSGIEGSGHAPNFGTDNLFSSNTETSTDDSAATTWPSESTEFGTNDSESTSTDESSTQASGSSTEVTSTLESVSQKILSESVSSETTGSNSSNQTTETSTPASGSSTEVPPTIEPVSSGTNEPDSSNQTTETSAPASGSSTEVSPTLEPVSSETNEPDSSNQTTEISTPASGSSTEVPPTLEPVSSGTNEPESSNQTTESSTLASGSSIKVTTNLETAPSRTTGSDSDDETTETSTPALGSSTDETTTLGPVPSGTTETDSNNQTTETSTLAPESSTELTTTLEPVPSGTTETDSNNQTTETSTPAPESSTQITTTLEPVPSGTSGSDSNDQTTDISTPALGSSTEANTTLELVPSGTTETESSNQTTETTTPATGSSTEAPTTLEPVPSGTTGSDSNNQTTESTTPATGSSTEAPTTLEPVPSGTTGSDSNNQTTESTTPATGSSTEATTTLGSVPSGTTGSDSNNQTTETSTTTPAFSTEVTTTLEPLPSETTGSDSNNQTTETTTPAIGSSTEATTTLGSVPSGTTGSDSNNQTTETTTPATGSSTEATTTLGSVPSGTTGSDSDNQTTETSTLASGSSTEAITTLEPVPSVTTGSDSNNQTTETSTAVTGSSADVTSASRPNSKALEEKSTTFSPESTVTTAPGQTKTVTTGKPAELGTSMSISAIFSTSQKPICIPRKPCEETVFGCCPDRKTIATGPFDLGCKKPRNCHETDYGCCPDGFSPAQGDDWQGCPQTPCAETLYGCCPDNKTSAEGNDQQGCQTPFCKFANYGCCADNVTEALGPNKMGCPEETTESSTTSESSSVSEIVTSAATEAETSPSTETGPTEVTEEGTSTSSEFSSTSDEGTSAATEAETSPSTETGTTEVTEEGTSISSESSSASEKVTSPVTEEGTSTSAESSSTSETDTSAATEAETSPSTETGTTEVTEEETSTSSESSSTSDEGTSAVTEAETSPSTETGTTEVAEEGTSISSESSSASEKVTSPVTEAETGTSSESYSSSESETSTVTTEITTIIDDCTTTIFGCCYDNETVATGADGAGCPCYATEFGCCPDGESPAQGPEQRGCLGACRNTQYGCCSDGETPAHGPNGEGCCLLTAFGCCRDNRRPAEGPHQEGCGCQSSEYGCCPNHVTAAEGPDNKGCGCQYTQYGCCPDRHTEATGPENEGCPCSTFQYGCCPDGVTTATGPQQHGCHCKDSAFSCCGDGQTPANSANGTDCNCAASQYGCCPDGTTTATGPKFLGCTDVPENKQAGCSMPMDNGTGYNYTVVWYYNRTYGGCAKFWYGGIGGNGNRFANKEICEDVCVHPAPKDVCKLPPVKGMCRKDVVRWYYDSERGQCMQFMYGGCFGNDNKFDTRELCEVQCQPQTSTGDVCSLPIERGSCAGNYSRWGYDRERGRCEQFSWGGCEGTANRFLSEAACRQRCRPPGALAPRCTAPQDPGVCTEKEALWSFSPTEDRCVPFYYTGCGGNDNRFASRTSCQHYCPSTYKPDRCTLPYDTGIICSEYKEHWFYDTTIKRCRMFWYGGCGGNTNNFDSEAECESTCSEATTTTSITTTTTTTTTTTMHEDICQLPMAMGPCDESVMRWFYNADTDSCNQFTYGGCEGNLNRFETREECEDKCRRPVDVTRGLEQQCRISEDLEPCSGAGVVWFYDPDIFECVNHQNWDSGERCRTTGVFPSQEACERSCGAFRGIDWCGVDMDPGPCQTFEVKVYYDREGDYCKYYQYGGCFGSANRFSSLGECEQVCKRNTTVTTTTVTTTTKLTPTTPAPPTESKCRISEDLEPCSGAGVVWFYDPEIFECVNHQNWDSGERCRTTGVFPSQEACERSCIYNNRDVCAASLDPGPCQDSITKYYWDVATARCEQFAYGGCGGGPNRFSSLEECDDVCGNRGPAPYCLKQVDPGSSCGQPSGVRWYYDSSRGICVVFAYQGCGGNENNFGTHEACADACRPIRDLPPQIDHTLRQPNCTTYTEECHRLRCEYNVEYSYTEEGCLRCACSPPPPDECEPVRRYCDTLSCPYGLREVTRSDGCQSCECNEDPCSRAQCRPTERCVTESDRDAEQQPRYFARCVPDPEQDLPPTPVAAPDQETQVSSSEGGTATLRCIFHSNPPPMITWRRGSITIDGPMDRYRLLSDGALEIVKLRRTDSGVYICVADNGRDIAQQEIHLSVHVETNEIDPCEQYKRECEQLKCKVRRTFTANGCERCTCEPVETDCTPFRRHCKQLKCAYGIDSTVPSDGCPRCQCAAHPCSTVRCAADETCTVLRYQDAAMREPRFTTECRKVTKPGMCPVEEAEPNEVCYIKCQKDSDCRGDGKCCWRGCSRLCMKPVPSTAVFTTTHLPELPRVPMIDPRQETNFMSSEGGKATLRCLFHSNPPPKITWRRGEITIDGNVDRYRLLSDGALEIVSLYRDDSGVYVCVGDNGLGVTRQEIRLIVSVPVVAHIRPPSAPPGIGGELSLVCEIEGFPDPEVYWTKDNTRLYPDDRTTISGNSTVSQLAIVRLAASDAGHYACHVKNDYTTDTATTQITIKQEVVIPARCTDSPYFANCALIVRSNFCRHKYYGSFCCKSCVEAGQLSTDEVMQADQPSYRRK